MGNYHQKMVRVNSQYFYGNGERAIPFYGVRNSSGCDTLYLINKNSSMKIVWLVDRWVFCLSSAIFTVITTLPDYIISTIHQCILVNPSSGTRKLTPPPPYTWENAIALGDLSLPISKIRFGEYINPHHWYIGSWYVSHCHQLYSLCPATAKSTTPLCQNLPKWGGI